MSSKSRASHALRGCGAVLSALVMASCSVPSSGPTSVDMLTWWSARGELDAMNKLRQRYDETHPHDPIGDNPLLASDVARASLRERMKDGLPPDVFLANGGWDLFQWVRYNGTVGDLTTAKGQYCAVYAAGKVLSADFTCNPDFAVYQVGVVTRWTPVKNLTFSAELGAFFLDQKMGAGVGGVATSVFGPGAPKPAALYEFKDQSTVHFGLRAQRNF